MKLAMNAYQVAVVSDYLLSLRTRAGCEVSHFSHRVAECLYLTVQDLS
jgi:hypothetical protein